MIIKINIEWDEKQLQSSTEINGEIIIEQLVWRGNKSQDELSERIMIHFRDIVERLNRGE